MRSSNWTTNGRLGKGFMGLAASVLCLCGTAALSPAQTGAPASDQKQDAKKIEKRDLLIFRSGNKVEGMILEETDTTVKFAVMISGIQTVTTYNKSDILEIKRNEFKPEGAKEGENKDDKKSEAPVAPAKPGELVDTKGKPIPEGTLKVYLAVFGGEFGRDVSKTPVTKFMDDAVRIQPDVIVVRFDHTFSNYGEQIDANFYHVGWQQTTYAQLDKAREIDTLITDRINNTSDFKKKPRLVAWISKALGGAAYLPFVFPEIYFTSQGRHGGIGGIDELFANRGDEVVRQKMRGLLSARCKGLAAKGGHDERIMSAMIRGDYILSYRMVGGKPEFLEDKMPPGPEWFVVKDDGPSNEANRDSLADIVRMIGNDYLTLGADTAFDIGFSKGTADTLDDLMFKMGITRNYAAVKNNSRDIFGDWSKDVGKCESDVQRLIRQFQNIEVRPPGGYQQRTAARTQRINTLRQIQSTVKTYAEAINPRAIGAPDDLITDTQVVIDRIQTEQRLDRPD